MQKMIEKNISIKIMCWERKAYVYLFVGKFKNILIKRNE